MVPCYCLIGIIFPCNCRMNITITDGLIRTGTCNVLKMIGYLMDDREIIGIGKFLTNHNLRYIILWGIEDCIILLYHGNKWSDLDMWTCR